MELLHNFICFVIIIFYELLSFVQIYCQSCNSLFSLLTLSMPASGNCVFVSTKELWQITNLVHEFWSVWRHIVKKDEFITLLCSQFLLNFFEFAIETQIFAEKNEQRSTFCHFRTFLMELKVDNWRILPLNWRLLFATLFYKKLGLFNLYCLKIPTLNTSWEEEA